MPRRPPSPATLISLVALFVALGGTSYAVVTITGSDIRNGTVTGLDVKDRSLAARDIRNGTIGTAQLSRTLSRRLESATTAQGEKGPIGDKGPAGDKGAAGDKGPIGDRGPIGEPGVAANGAVARSSNTFVQGNSGQPRSITLPNLSPGTYVLLGKAVVGPSGATGDRTMQCTLTAGSASDASFERALDGFFVTINTQLVHTFAATGSAVMTCQSAEGSFTMSNLPGDTSIVATRVQSASEVSAAIG